jgi:hypothetical protein
LRDDVVDGVVAVNVGGAEVAANEAALEPADVALVIAVVADAEVAKVLFQEGFVLVIFFAEIGLDLGRSGMAFAVEGAAGREVEEGEGEEAR